MTIKDIVNQTGLTPQAIYKRIKAKGYTMSALKSKNTGHFTPEGEQVVRDLFGIVEEAKPEEKPVEKSVEKLTTEVERLTTEVEKLTTEVENLRSERDFLRMSLERAQQLQAVTLTKLPNPPAALPAGGEKGVRGWWHRIRGGNKDGK